MTIERRKKSVVRFEELSAGAVFEYEGEIYMKTDGKNITAVELGFGLLSDIKKDKLVKILDAKLMVKE